MSRLKRNLRALLIFLLVFWLFSGWPKVWRNPPFPPMVEKTNAAISAVTGRGSNITGTGNNTSLSVTPTANITVGKMAFFAVATDNENTTDGCGGTLHTLTGTAGNTWTKILECTETDGSSDDGVTISLFATKVTTQINTTDTVTISFNTGRSDTIAMLFEVTVGAGNTLEIAQIGTGQASLTSSVSGLNSREYLLLNLVGAEGEDNSKTQSTNYTELFDLWSTSSGSAALNVSAYVQTRIATLTSSSATPSTWTYTNPFASLTALFEDVLPTLSISQPDGDSDIVTVGDSYNVTYTLADSDDTVTAAFYYDTDTDMTGGTAISGACTSAAEGTNATCSWDTTDVTPGNYYVYGITSGDGGINGEVKAISSGQITIQVGGTLTVDIVDSGGNPVSSPSMAMSTVQLSFSCQTPTGTFGASEERIRITNTTASPAWTLTVAATDGSTATWSTGSLYYDFNDGGGSGCTDGGDSDSYAGQMTLDSSVGTITPQGGCSTTGLSLGSSAAYSEGVTDSVTLITASASAETSCYWDLTGVSVSQKIPSEQSTGNYSLNMTLTITAT